MVTHSKENLAAFRRAYDLLQLETEATPKIIKEKYRELVKKWHPDKWACDDEKELQATKKLQGINVAYDLVSWAPLRYYKSNPEIHTGAAAYTATGTAPNKNRQKARSYRKRKSYGKYRYRAQNKRHNNVNDANEFRKRSAGRFRFLTGFFGSAIPLAIVRSIGMIGPAFMVCCVLLPLFLGWNAWRKDILDMDEDTLF